MPRKKSAASIDTLLARPWCFYCERDFDDLKVLISHQRALHFRCDKCSRRLNTAGGLVIHAQQVHKDILTEVSNAIKGRERADIEIFGLEGVPEDAVRVHEAKIRERASLPESTARPATPPPASTARESPLTPPPAKRAKITTIDRAAIQARLEAHKAAKKAQAVSPPGSNPPDSQSTCV